MQPVKGLFMMLMQLDFQAESKENGIDTRERHHFAYIRAFCENACRSASTYRYMDGIKG